MTLLMGDDDEYQVIHLKEVIISRSFINASLQKIALTFKNNSVMHLDILSHGLQITMELENKMRMKFEAIGKLYKHITGYEVKIKKSDISGKMKFEVEGRVRIPKSSFFCREAAETFETAFDQVVENLKRQLKWKKQERAEIW
ncbi:hypothetical protein FAM09_13685 [Niastella caeni]|uniref:Ribosome-associated translation inhibitor RaiA n=1 Tax=Niastella caeni TaxID=2569763 RepID=A0A4S8HVC7_9BACT|nr:HPF/RaiA family ribosome-associated protein [Niastella caeni]THU39550.1 hypothetical protein FAM09_13685 [Niastella caeni]